MRLSFLLVFPALLLPACTSPRRGGDTDAAIDAPASADLGAADLGPADLGLVDVGAVDLGTTDSGAPDLGPGDLGLRDLGPPDLGLRDLGPPDLGPPDLGAADAGPPASRYVLGAPGANCDMTCGALGLVCGRPPGSVGLQCGVHTDIATCNDPANWIYRYNPATKPMPYCRGDWGTSDVCNNNYNVSNAFCCYCI